MLIYTGGTFIESAGRQWMFAAIVASSLHEGSRAINLNPLFGKA